MDRRTLLKSSGLLLSGLALASDLANAKVTTVSADKPLLLNFNENSLGMSPNARQAIIDSLDLAYRYPDSQREALIGELARYHQVTEKQITLGNGSSETIQAGVQSAIINAQQKGLNVQLVVPDPTFNYAELYAKSLGVAVVKVALNRDLAFNLSAMRKVVNQFDGVSIIYLCNPNNPTATIMPTEGLAEWIEESKDKSLFLFDEAYAEYVSDPAFVSGLNFINQGYQNVLVTRTFSKIYAMAGLRLGYGIGHPSLITQVDDLVSIDNTNLAAAVAGLASLKDKTFLSFSQKSNQLALAIVTAALDKLAIHYLPSQANFIFHRVKGDMKTYQQRMLAHNIWVGREFPPAHGWSRLTLGTPEEMQRFVQVLYQFREKGWI